jgi:hypothetical protein
MARAGRHTPIDGASCDGELAGDLRATSCRTVAEVERPVTPRKPAALGLVLQTTATIHLELVASDLT